MAPSFDDHPTSRAATSIAKIAKLSHDHHHHHHPLLPGLPDHIAQLCLSRVPPSTLYSVCRSWRRLIYSSAFPPFLSLYTLSSTASSALQVSSFDPISSQWSVVTLSTHHLHRICHRHPSFIARNLSIQSVSVAGNLVLLAGTSGDLLPALSRPLMFNPLSRSWSSGPPLSTPRRWCATGVSRAAVVVASGFGSHYTQTVARSVEKWVFRETNLSDGKRRSSNVGWKMMRSLKEGKLSREAIDAVGCKGKLFMVNMKSASGKEGVVYDVDSDWWSEMPAGMLNGWRGPAASMDEDTIYMVDESQGLLLKYDEVMENWVDVLVDDMLKGAEHIAAGGGRVCVVCSGGMQIVVVDVVSLPRLWVLDAPAGEQILRLHILPRMCRPELGCGSGGLVFN